MGLPTSAVRLNPLGIVTPRSTEIIVAVECLKAGQKACTADSNGNIGSGNKGKNNFGTKNVGDDNIGTVEFTIVDSSVDVTFVVTAVGYIPSGIRCSLYSANFTLLTYGAVAASSMVTTINNNGEMDYVFLYYSIGSVLAFINREDLNDVAPLTLLNPPSPSSDPPPPPPSFGTITGSITYSTPRFTFTVSTGVSAADTLYYAFFSANGGLVESGSETPDSADYTWTSSLHPSQLPFVAYAQVVAESSTRGLSSALTLNW
ncbi:hypothetical protein F751_1837 [Auxenochlorella protothecoides]|uniref:Uncharacterized protein n=1 Tax=Auxenochlorella protothecoides TaxID=3075 RepID=A0A087SGV4_AUXPR|nr:hypothetical protein F751_1837 [Auxenochlorella protothecoides]KFM24958.1 hypothetical protein F751_1837 [Auxenochlorella protothecoides]